MTSLRAALGEGVRRLREEHGVRQEDVSAAARRHGLNWSRVRVGELEAGGKAISADELLLLPLVLSDAVQRSVTLPEILEADLPIELSPEVSLRGWVAHRLLAGDDLGDVPLGCDGLAGPSVGVRRSTGHQPGGVRSVRTGRDRRQQLAERLAIFLPAEMTADKRDALLTGTAGEAERKAASRLGEDPLLVLALSRVLWNGRSLSEERDRLVDERPDAGSDPDRLRALRGRVARQLVDQLREAVDSAPSPQPLNT